ncbi:hypothetical protein V6N13_076515 [Hibiscus sabdariffa]
MYPIERFLGKLKYQWEDACHFWNSAKGQARERIGVASRQQQKFTHTAGSKSFARIANEQEATSGSNEPRPKFSNDQGATLGHRSNPPNDIKVRSS